MDLLKGQHILMKKPHPCGSYEFELTRVGMDLKIKCTRCGREVMLPRKKVEKNIKTVLPLPEEKTPH